MNITSNFYKHAGKLTSDAALDPAGLVAIAIAHALALFVGVSMAANISGGHLNPAVTLGLAIGGNITIITGLFYWIAQLLGSTVACFLLQFVTGGLVSYSYKHSDKILLYITAIKERLAHNLGCLLIYMVLNRLSQPTELLMA